MSTGPPRASDLVGHKFFLRELNGFGFFWDSYRQDVLLDSALDFLIGEGEEFMSTGPPRASDLVGHLVSGVSKWLRVVDQLLEEAADRNQLPDIHMVLDFVYPNQTAVLQQPAEDPAPAPAPPPASAPAQEAAVLGQAPAAAQEAAATGQAPPPGNPKTPSVDQQCPRLPTAPTSINMQPIPRWNPEEMNVLFLVGTNGNPLNSNRGMTMTSDEPGIPSSFHKRFLHSVFSRKCLVKMCEAANGNLALPLVTNGLGRTIPVETEEFAQAVANIPNLCDFAKDEEDEDSEEERAEDLPVE